MGYTVREDVVRSKAGAAVSVPRLFTALQSGSNGVPLQSTSVWLGLHEISTELSAPMSSGEV